MPTPIEVNKSLVCRFRDAIEGAVSPDYNDHLAGQSPGRENLKKYFAGVRSAFPDLGLQIMYMVAEGDKVATLTGFREAHKGSSGGFEGPASGSTERPSSCTGSRMDSPLSTGRFWTTGRSSDRSKWPKLSRTLEGGVSRKHRAQWVRLSCDLDVQMETAGARATQYPAGRGNSCV